MTDTVLLHRLPCSCLENDEKWKTRQSAVCIIIVFVFLQFLFFHSIFSPIQYPVNMNGYNTTMYSRRRHIPRSSSYHGSSLTPSSPVCLPAPLKDNPWITNLQNVLLRLLLGLAFLFRFPRFLLFASPNRCSSSSSCALNFTRIPYNLGRRRLVSHFSVVCVLSLCFSVLSYVPPQGSIRQTDMCSVPCTAVKFTGNIKTGNNCNRRNINST